MISDYENISLKMMVAVTAAELLRDSTWSLNSYHHNSHHLTSPSPPGLAPPSNICEIIFLINILIINNAACKYIVVWPGLVETAGSCQLSSSVADPVRPVSSYSGWWTGGTEELQPGRHIQTEE